MDTMVRYYGAKNTKTGPIQLFTAISFFNFSCICLIKNGFNIYIFWYKSNIQKGYIRRINKRENKTHQ